MRSFEPGMREEGQDGREGDVQGPYDEQTLKAMQEANAIGQGLRPLEKKTAPPAATVTAIMQPPEQNQMTQRMAEKTPRMQKGQ